MSDSEDLVELPEEDEEEDLFGDEPADDAQEDRSRAGSERAASELDGGEEGERGDDDVPHDYETRMIEAIEMQRHRVPKAKDQRLRSLRVPRFMRFVPTLYDPDTFEPTEEDIENARADMPKADVRVRRHGNKLQSNAMIHRWSDGSVTITVGDEHFEVATKALAPGPDQPYSELQDGHYYAASAEYSSNFLMFVGHVTDQYIIRPGKDVQDDALIALAERMATVSQKPQEKDMIINTIQDPELRKRQAEQAEKERMKMQRRRETAAARQDASRGYGRGGGLSMGDLDGGRRAGGSRKRGMPGAPKQKRRRPEYDSDDDLPSGARREDDYDMEDDFIVGSDEDISEGGEDDNEEILDDEDDEDEAPRSKKRQKTSDDEDADGDNDDMEPSGRGRRRHVVDDDDSE
ncbi:RNA polymerase-associated protein LEO1 [Colletotrichum orbiculare MAFF 240422]|uniref:RNA polymerase-associated protein LEO1 n=1 Tax=Colletotrichum orbiculare (strain 104-T / ATCC 96160 / CBS 514.97 / LARS 414 / MAFF 240422) TaxID=1213857 RepID=N4V795_COLOR|nr:RNA polymerase-associated protein LEO1 [Colletotrichum orbiculare MAFF 240422]